MRVFFFICLICVRRIGLVWVFCATCNLFHRRLAIDVSFFLFLFFFFFLIYSIYSFPHTQLNDDSSRHVVLIMFVTFVAVVEVVAYWRRLGRVHSNASKVNPVEFRKHLQNRQFRYNSWVFLIISGMFSLLFALKHTVTREMMIWMSWNFGFQATTVWLLRFSFDHDLTVLFWGWCNVAQNFYLAWGSGLQNAFVSVFYWGMGVTFPLLVVMCGLPHHAWAMFFVQLLAVASSVFFEPFLPLAILQSEAWTQPAITGLLQLVMLSLNSSSINAVYKRLEETFAEAACIKDRLLATGKVVAL